MECNLSFKPWACLRRPSACRGITLIEVLVAALIAGTSLASVISFWYAAFAITTQSDQLSVAYNLGRHAAEAVKEMGFNATPEGSGILFYDNQGGSESATRTSAHVYSVITTVNSDLTVSGSNPVQPAPDALRTVTVTVLLLSSGQTVYQTGTYLARAGI